MTGQLSAVVATKARLHEKWQGRIMRGCAGEVIRRQSGITLRFGKQRAAAGLTVKCCFCAGKVAAQTVDQAGALWGAGDCMHRGGWGKVGHGNLH